MPSPPSGFFVVMFVAKTNSPDCGSVTRSSGTVISAPVPAGCGSPRTTGSPSEGMKVAVIVAVPSSFCSSPEEFTKVACSGSLERKAGVPPSANSLTCMDRPGSRVMFTLYRSAAAVGAS